MTKKNKAILYLLEKGYTVTKEGKMLNPSKIELKGHVNEDGYTLIGIRLKKGSGTTVVKIHRVQAFQKYGEAIFDKLIQVRHLNGIPSDNSWENIAIGSFSDNQMDIPKEVRVLRASNPKHDHESIIKDRKDGMSYKEIMIKYSISSKGTVSFIINKSLKNKK